MRRQRLRSLKRRHQRTDQMKILFVSLGCDKNRVDTEVMLGLLVSRGHSFTDEEDESAEVPLRVMVTALLSS